MKLYYSPGACSLASHIVLFASGLPFDAESVSLREVPHTTAGGVDFTTINPKGYVPALRLDNGELLTEGVAIMQYVADQAPDKQLAPANGTLPRYRLQEWLNFISTEIHKNFSPLFFGKNDEAKDDAWGRLQPRFALLQAQLEKTPYLLGGQFSVADAYLFTCLSWAQYVQRSLADYPALLDYLKRVAALPAAQQALKAEGLLK
ncbi:glutathione transferase GstA [Chromobacterium violaceum]|uniref:Glutathione S-transferase GST-6.0 n=1 Tax=Chromobacterium violaceum TaxID=536 RepID=A0A381F2X3_CHRVL|nr:glutathione transferase GstA [Chromobacterium violaceum]OLZ83081.1 glutathione transferase GstA [Chromobacterium violaceum]OQS10514.1 glutathione transferase GstA [Chromobacterium violaceum]OQS29799.1 glutathione transferase GstA [Chromobacterium violaceum]STB70472.1 Glutathione S-transferase GST-6.0 [Chromobacterium violaceum]SUX35123.1 Glutathione S-transferase GST-6.0 [Chromobacterium violaceum]